MLNVGVLTHSHGDFKKCKLWMPVTQANKWINIKLEITEQIETIAKCLASNSHKFNRLC